MKIGFIGAGEMGRAIIKGLINAKHVASENILIHSAHKTSYEPFAQQYHLSACATNRDVVVNSDVVVLAVIPDYADAVLREVKAELAGKTLISIVGGMSIAHLEEVGGALPILRSLPNINVAGNVGMTALAANDALSGARLEQATALFEAIGDVSWQAEDKFAIFSAIAGSGPAYVDYFIDALSRAGVKYGLTKKDATRIAAMTVQGSSEMVLRATDETPMDFVDAVCSPGGSTVAGLLAMEEAGLTTAVVKGIDATVDKN